MKKIGLNLFFVVCLLPLLNGCAAIGLTLFGVGAGVATGTSVSYTLDGIAYRTFTVPLPQSRERNSHSSESNGHKS